MTTIIVKPKTVEEQDFLWHLLKKMNVDAEMGDDFIPNEETRKAIEDVRKKKGNRVKNTSELFSKLGI